MLNSSKALRPVPLHRCPAPVPCRAVPFRAALPVFPAKRSQAEFLSEINCQVNSSEFILFTRVSAGQTPRGQRAQLVLQALASPRKPPQTLFPRRPFQNLLSTSGYFGASISGIGQVDRKWEQTPYSPGTRKYLDTPDRILKYPFLTSKSRSLGTFYSPSAFYIPLSGDSIVSGEKTPYSN